MRPRPRGRGIAGQFGIDQTTPGSFNAGTPARSWNLLNGRRCWQLAWGFNEAPTARSWNFLARPHLLRALDGFNEATTARSWNSLQQVGALVIFRASMRPRPRGRGI